MKGITAGIVTNTINDERTQAAIFAMCTQTMRPERVLVCYNGSEKLSELVRNLMHTLNIECYSVPVGLPLSNYRKSLVEHVDTEKVLMVDSDVLMFPDCLESMFFTYQFHNAGVVSATLTEVVNKNVFGADDWLRQEIAFRDANVPLVMSSCLLFDREQWLELADIAFRSPAHGKGDYGDDDLLMSALFSAHTNGCYVSANARALHLRGERSEWQKNDSGLIWLREYLGTVLDDQELDKVMTRLER